MTPRAPRPRTRRGRGAVACWSAPLLRTALALLPTAAAAQATDAPQAVQRHIAAADGGSAPSEYWLARHYGGETGIALDPPRAAAYLQRAARHGLAPAQAALAFAYLNGSAGHPKDLHAAFGWFRKAADQDAVVAQCMLGDFYLHGWGGARADAAQAYRWYARTATAADRCAPKSQFALYRLYLAGDGVRRDPAQAMQWLRRSADAGNPQAQAALGRAYQQGAGVERDPVRARQWILKSREGVSQHDDEDHDHDVASDGRHGGPAHAR